MMRYVTRLPCQWISQRCCRLKKHEIGYSYRTDQAYAALGSIRLSKRFVFGLHTR
jgi:hypothetical protein